MISLYANLLNPSADSTPGTIARAPVVFKQQSEVSDAQADESTAKKQQLNPGTFEKIFITALRQSLLTFSPSDSFSSIPTHQKTASLKPEA